MDVDEGQAFNHDNMFKFVDTLFERNVDEYSKNPEKLMEVVKAQCLPHFQSCKSLNCIGYDMVKDGELVRMRCMIQDAKGVEMFVASGIAHDDIDQQNGSNPGNDAEKTVCGVLRDSLKCTSVKEVVAMRSRHNYMVVPVPGATDWFLEEFNRPCPSTQQSGSEAMEQESLKKSSTDDHSRKSVTSSCDVSKTTNSNPFALKAKFFFDSAEDLLPNHVFDLYGVLDKTAILCNSDENDSADVDSEKVQLEPPRIHVIHYESVEHHESISIPPQLSRQMLEDSEHCNSIQCIRNVLCSLLCDGICADYLLCHLVSTTFARPENHPICSMPLNLINVSDSRAIIRMLNALVPKVQVIELSIPLLRDTTFASVMDHDSDKLQQGRLQLSNGTQLIVDETKLTSGVIPLVGNAEKNLNALRNIVSSQKVDYDYKYYQLPLPCDINVLMLSRHPAVSVEAPFVVALPPQFSDGLDPTSEMLREYDSEQMRRMRYALLRSRKAVKDVQIGDEINKLISEGFIRMRESHSREDASAQLHRLLTLGRLLAAIDCKKELDEECWNRARKMEAKRRVDLAELLR